MNSTFDLDVYLDLNSDAFAPASPPPTTTAAASQVSYSSHTTTAPATSSSSSPLTRPATTTASATPEFPAPSHPYDLHPQQTMPLMGMDIYGDMGMLGLDNEASSLHSTPFAFFDPTVAMQHSPAQSDTSMGMNSISPLMTTVDMAKAETSQAPSTTLNPAALPALNGEDRKMYRGIHSQMAQQKILQQQQQQAARAAAMMHGDPKDIQINQIFNSLRAQPVHRPPPSTLPLVDKLKKEEAEMDDDERLLASEEGKKLSSKERRQLRNKVSARAFRSRRKEYINQLEAEVNRKTVEAQALADKVEELRISNERFEAFMRTLLRTQHFNHFLNDITSSGTQINDILKAIPQAVPQQAAPQQQTPPRAALPKFVNPNQSEEWSPGYPSWASQGMPQVYSVSIPEPPTLADLDLKMDYGFEDDALVSDGFYPMIRNEKADIDYTRIHEDEDYEIAEATYNPPELLSDVILAEEQKEKAKSKPDLDALFPGVGVNSLLERLEKVAGGEARPEELFEGVAKNDAAVNSSAQTQASGTEGPSTPSLCRSNNMISRAEGVYRRIGLMVE